MKYSYETINFGKRPYSVCVKVAVVVITQKQQLNWNSSVASSLIPRETLVEFLSLKCDAHGIRYSRTCVHSKGAL